MQQKSWILWAIMTAAALAMNLTRFEYRYVIFPAMLLLFPLIADKSFNHLQTLSPTRNGLKLFLSITALVYLFYPPLFYGYYTLFLHKTMALPEPAALLQAILKGAALILLVALPEEIFFRAFFQEKVFQGYHKKLFFVVSQKNFLTSLLFGLTHALAFLDIQRAATFFPSLLFGWMVEKSGGRVIYAVLFHGLANILAFMLMTGVTK